MTAQVLSFLRRPIAPRDWAAQELAEFYRVEAALIQAGLRVTIARGLTDEGEPWFVFCRAEDDDVVIHFARIEGRYVVSAPAYCGNASGSDFRALVRSLIERQPVLHSLPRGNNLFLHPAALLVMLVAAALLKSGHAAEAAPVKAVADAPEGKSRDAASAAALASAAAETIASEARHERLILAAITAAIAPLMQTEPFTIVVSASAHLQSFVDQSHNPSIDLTPQDWSRDAATHGAGSTTPSLLSQHLIAAPLVEATPSTLIHNIQHLDAAPGLIQQDAATAPVFLSSAAGLTIQTTLLSGSLLIPTEQIAFAGTPDPAQGAQHLSLSSLPDISKADLDLLHTLGVSDNVAYTATLPTAIATVLWTGTHASVSGTSITHSAADFIVPTNNATASSPDVAPVHLTIGSDAEAPAAVAATVPATATETTAAATIAPPVPVATPATVAIPAPPATPDMSSVLNTVEQFQAIAIHPVVVISDHSAIFYDAAAVTNDFSAVRAVTYDLSDGFSISLIGLPAELSHAGVHV
jgi:hypothetical protein